MVNKIIREEKATVSYDGSSIIVKGDDFNISVLVSSSDLMGIYMSGKGTAKVKLSVDLPEEPKPEPVIVQKEIAPAPVTESNAPIPVKSTQELKPVHVSRKKIKKLDEVQQELNIDYDNAQNKGGS